MPDLAIANLVFIVRQIDVRVHPSAAVSHTGGGERPTVRQSLVHVLWIGCHADSIRVWDAGAVLSLRSEGAVPCCSQPEEISAGCWEVNLGESMASVHWDLQKFYDSVVVRPGTECGFPMRVAAVDLQVHAGAKGPAFGWRVC